MIQENIKILLVEDNPIDAKLIERQVRKIVEKPEMKHISGYEYLVTVLENFKPDVVLCDYNLEGFTGMDVLIYINKTYPGIPFIFVTGTVDDEELAANTILSGASGFILKNKPHLVHKKLLPHFEKIILKKKRVNDTGEHRKVLREIEKFIEEIRTENQVYQASYAKIQKSLQEFKVSREWK